MNKVPLPDEDNPETWVNPPEFVFRVFVGDEARAQVFGPKEKRNWVMFKLSRYALAFEDEGIVSVKRYINGEWIDYNGWRHLAH